MKITGEKGKISIIMPCYNGEKYLSQSIESILHQTFSDFQYIIINDGSTDNSEEIIKAYLKDNRIEYISLSKNAGNYKARNLGMQRAIGQYICVMDADDVADCNRLGIQFDYLQQNKSIGLIGAQADWINHAGNLLDFKIHKPTCSSSDLKAMLLSNNQIVHSSVMFRAGIARNYNLSYNTRLKYSGDYQFVYRFSTLCKIRNIENTLIKYRLHNQQISTKHKMEQRKFADIVRKQQLRKFFTRVSHENEVLFLKFMNLDEEFSPRELNQGCEMFNKLLQRNIKLGLYNQSSLYRFFDSILLKAVAREKK